MTKGVPLALSHNVNCNHVLHERVLLVAANVAEVPRMPDEERVLVRPLAEGLTRVEIRFGFMDDPNIPEALAVAMARGQIEPFDLNRVIYYTGHETIIPSGRRPGLPMARGDLRLPAPQRPAPGRLLQDSRLANHGNRTGRKNAAHHQHPIDFGVARPPSQPSPTRLRHSHIFWTGLRDLGRSDSLRR